jgi:UDP-N-acetylmuramate: L-alanyl-gamma-D-glutamyl-meso-diaminopimelate ligase
MKIYILGICGTFMAGLALLARDLGHQVSGADAQVYPPMSTQLANAGIDLREGYTRENLDLDADLFVIGNAMSRGNPQVEAILELGLPYTSGPQWLHDHLLKDRWVLAVAGTHGKTTTSSMIAWILEYAGMNPGFLIGGLTRNFNCSARLGSDPFFVIEADEYDTAFFDKRSKFVHYAPRSLVLNNLEFDHADIFDNLDAIKRQFHHLMRIVPPNGLVIHNRMESELDNVLAMGCWTPTQDFADQERAPGAELVVAENHIVAPKSGQRWALEPLPTGHFNHLNACAAALAARHAGVPFAVSFEALGRFSGVKRRQEVVAEIDGIRVIDDFAHHPTAIRATLDSLRASTIGRLVAVFEPRSNTMKAGVHRDTLGAAFDAADYIVIYDNGQLDWNPHEMTVSNSARKYTYTSVDEIVDQLVEHCREDDTIVIMSNGGFEGLQGKLLSELTAGHHG